MELIEIHDGVININIDGDGNDPNTCEQLPSPEFLSNLWDIRIEPLLKFSPQFDSDLLATFESDPLAFAKETYI